jgi:hypothetical protein
MGTVSVSQRAARAREQGMRKETNVIPAMSAIILISLDILADAIAAEPIGWALSLLASVLSRPGERDEVRDEPYAHNVRNCFRRLKGLRIDCSNSFRLIRTGNRSGASVFC